MTDSNPRGAMAQLLIRQLARLRATTPAAGRSLDVAALIREDRDSR